jgi:hypothetical protein
LPSNEAISDALGLIVAHRKIQDKGFCINHLKNPADMRGDTCSSISSSCACTG